MSNRVTNVEIEDVLSSVKRLVSTGKTVESKGVNTLTEHAAKPDRFLLTQALRVGGPSEQFESTLDQSDDVWTVDGADGAADDATSASKAPETASDRKSDRNSLEATIAELEAAVTEQPDDWEPDGSEVDVDKVPSWDKFSYPSLDEVEDAVAVDADDADTTLSAADMARIGVPLAAFDAAEPEITEDADADYGDDLVPDEDTATTDSVTDLDTVNAGETALIDETVLRDLVLEIVRDELQGKMGEKITRNVRKMVRREIHRVIASQDLD